MLSRVFPSVVLIAVLSSAVLAQSRPDYVREGDRVEQEFAEYRDRLEAFFVELRTLIQRGAPALVPELEPDDAPPRTGVYGYQMLPPIVEEYKQDAGERITTFTYSWGVTRTYIRSEGRKLEDAWVGLRRLAMSIDEDRARSLIEQYHELVDNQKIIDQYVQYNRFWQGEISRNRSRFDRFTEIYGLLVSGAPGAADRARDMLTPPKVPSFITIDRAEGRTVLRLPVYTDIADDGFLEAVEEGVERLWQVESPGPAYQLDVEFRKLAVSEVYPGGRAPAPGDHIDIASHADRFPDDGALLTTGAQSTYGFVGRYVALGPGEISVRTLAHEFGHVLGFDDGYIRGYRDVGERGFEILELTAFFEDIMSAPREGRVLPSHFELMVEGANSDE